MSFFVEQEPSPVFWLPWNRIKAAKPCRRVARHLKPILLASVGLSTIASSPAQQPTTAGGSAVRAAFRTAPRSPVLQNVALDRLAAVPGAVPGQVAGAQDLGARDPSSVMEHMQLALRRPAERQAAFDAEVDALHRPGDASYHQWLTPEAIGAEFGPSAPDIAAVTSFLRAEGFTVNAVARSGMFVDFAGTVAQVERSFHTEVHNLQLPDGEIRYAAIREAQLPEALLPVVAALRSLDNMLPRPLVEPVAPRVSTPAASRSLASTPNNANGSNNDLGAQDFYTIYNENPLLSVGINGSGITIALLEQTDIHASDVSTFRTLMGISPAAPSLSVLHGAGSITCSDPGITGDEIEAVLDTEWASAAAPGASLLYMSCPNAIVSAEAVVDNNLAPVLSLSYGATEVGNLSTATFLANLWEQAAAQGQTVVVSSGDAGSANTQDQNKSIASHGLAVNALGSSAYNVSAGGTDFQDLYNGLEGDAAFSSSTYWAASNGPGLSSALSYVPETTWNITCASSILSFYVTASSDPNALCNTAQYLNTGGGGGGVSISQPRPSWQNGTVFGIPPASLYNFRLLPDLSLFASNGRWGHALDFYQADTSSSLQRAGGTSFVAPQLAGIFALIAQKTGERLGQPNYVLYTMAAREYGVSSYVAGSACNGSGASGTGTTSTSPINTCIFYDVETGNNSQGCSAGSANCYTESGSDGILSTSTSAALPAYPSSAGFDLATGLGSVNITNLVNNWQNAAAGGFVFTPSVVVTSSAAAYTYGSPPGSITYKATVSGTGSFPTGSVTFSGSPAISTIGTDALVSSSGCSNGGTCSETATQTFSPAGTLTAGAYTITGTYSSTNENYANGSGTTSLTVNQQTPSVSVSAVSIAAGSATANLSASVSYTGTGVAPAGGLTFRVDSGAIVSATCVNSASPEVCSYSGYNTAGLASGSHTITANSLADANYTAATGTNTLSVLPAPAIVFAVPTHHTMDTPFPVTATSNSTGSITYSVVSGPATIAGNTVTLTGAAGTVILQASQSATSGFAGGTKNASFSVIAGSVWLGNSSGSVSAMDLQGLAISGSGGFTGAGAGSIAAPLGLAFDASGTIWIASSSGVSALTRQGVPLAATPYTGAGISNPAAIAIDGAGQVWVANANGTVSVLSNSGTAISPASGYPGAATPAGIAIDISGSVWIPNRTGNSVTRILGAAAPVVPLSTGAASGPGAKP